MLLLVLFGLTSLVASSPSIITTANGTIHGGACSGGRADSYFAIPYGKPPVGDLRFAPPQPYGATYSGGVLNATTPAPSCPQLGVSFVEAGAQSEDCLFVDVWTPSNATSSSKLPVKVFLYGGGDQTGGISDPDYTGCFTATDAIVVSVNYRIGPLGFLALKSAGLSGNYGIQDILLALRWVQENIAAFGGDPTQVLLFGQSAGAFNAFVISTLPQAPSLIKAAVFESAGGDDFATVAEAEASNVLFVTRLNCSITDLSCLRSKTPEEFNATVNTTPVPNIPLMNSLLEQTGRGEAWGPLVDGDVVPVQPSQAGIKVPAIFGSVADEGTLLVLGQYGNGIVNLTESDYDEFLIYSFGDLAPVVNTTYSLSNFSTSPMPVFSAMSSVITDYQYRCPSYRGLLAAAAKDVPVWTFRFNHTPSCSWLPGITYTQQTQDLLGATHSSDLPFVLGLVENLPPLGGDCNFTTAEKQISEQMVAAWTSMAASGSPGGNWPTFTADESMGVIIDGSVHNGVVDYSMCAFWDSIDGKVFEEDANRTAVVSSNTSYTTSGSRPVSTVSMGTGLSTSPVGCLFGLMLLVFSVSPVLF